jgi:hypothetical protein
MNDPKNAALYGKQFQRGQMTKPYIFGKEILPILTNYFHIESIIDIGSGNCGFLKAAMEMGITDVIGVDGNWIENLMIPKKYFKAFNLRMPFKLDREFDLVVSLEVAEHLNETFAMTFIETLTGLGDTILFSAARPGQGGVNHVNCQPPEYWEKRFNILNFVKLKKFNIQAILNDEPVKNLWQTKNSMVYIRKSND